MLTTAIIAFREFLEAFLIVGVFLGVSRSLNLKREFEILLAAAVGIALSLLGTTGMYVFGDYARAILTEEKADFLESYLLVFSGLFIAYVVFSLHGMMNKNRAQQLNAAKEHLKGGAFKISLFLTVLFLVIREGFEIALFTARVSAASGFGLLTYLAYTHFPIEKIFRATEYAIILLGAALTQNGITKLFETHFAVRLSDMASFNFQFLPDEDSFLVHVLQGIFGVDQEFSLVRLVIMLAYVALIYIVFMKKPALEP